VSRTFYDRKIKRVRDLSCGDKRVFLDVEIRRIACTRCTSVKTETLRWIAKNPFYTKRFSYYVGRRCREASIKSLADELRLDWKTVKELEKEYMAEQLRRAPEPKPTVIGVDEISIRKGHTYRIIVSDLERCIPIWFGGQDRSEKSMALFYEWLGAARCKALRLAVMDMWKPFRTALVKHAPQTKVLHDKFHVLMHLGEALDKVRRSQYRRLQGKERSYIKGQRFTLLAHGENLRLDARQALDKLLEANDRLNAAYVLKESFGQLWDYKSEAWARK
jgi:transposase